MVAEASLPASVGLSGLMEKRELPVEFIQDEVTPSFHFEIRESVLTPYEDSFSYVLKLDLGVDAVTVKELSLLVTLRDDSGEARYTGMMDALADYQPGLLPGETLPANLLIYRKEPLPDIRRAEVQISYIRKEGFLAATVTYPEKDLTWPIPIPPDVHLSMVERENTLSPSFDTSYYHLVFVLTNTGTRSIDLLKLRVDWYNRAGVVMGAQETYGVSISDSSFLPGQKRTAFVLYQFDQAKPDIAGYRVNVIEIQ